MTFDEVCNELELENTPDWGIINSDGSRVLEFIHYIDERDYLDFTIRYSFVELIIASMNDAIMEGKADCEVHSKFYEYIKPILNDNKYYPYVTYWISIKSEEEYPVGYLLEKYKMKDQEETA